jgi:phosphoserine phosphatase RsbU/P
LEHQEAYIRQLEKDVAYLKEQNASMLGMFEMTTAYLEQTRQDLKQSEQRLIRVNKHLTDSIQYAKHIQEAFVVDHKILQRWLPNSFILQRPKDIVSGDFVWMAEQKNTFYIGLGDCTGHGVPGAMLSVFVISMLNQLIQEQSACNPSGLLAALDFRMQEMLNRYTIRRDSVEIALISYDPQTSALHFSGAKRPLLHIREGVPMLYKGAKFMMGSTMTQLEPLKNTRINLLPGDTVYLFSDGFTDQFGGENAARYSSKKLIQSLTELSKAPIRDQYPLLLDELLRWQGTHTQIDDILVLGFQI